MNRSDMYLTLNHKYFATDKLPMLREKLDSLSDERYMMLCNVELRDPAVMLTVSVLLGGFGVDRFMLGDTGMGVLKLLTGGCCGILAIIDWFGIVKKTKEANFNAVVGLLL